MPIRYADPFRDPTDLPHPGVNPFIQKMVDGAESGKLGILYGEALRERPGRWLASEGSSSYEKLVVEIGCHKGDVLSSLSRAHKDTLFVGLDITFKRVVATAEKGARFGCDNLRSVLANARGLSSLFAEGELDGVVIFYPDPWTRKKRQLKNRLLDKDFLFDVYKLLKPGGFFWFKTDHAGYFHDVAKEAESCGLMLAKDVSNAHEVTKNTYVSPFEEGFTERQVPKSEGVWLKVSD